MNKSYYSFIAATLILLSACTAWAEAPSSPTTPAAEISTVDSPAISTPTTQPATPTSLHTTVAPISLERPYDKASFQEGPFDFEVYLYQDSGISQNPTMPWMYSDLPGVGSHVSWTYHGSGINDQVSESWGTCPEISPRQMYHGLKDGDHGIREGGILLPKNLAPELPVQFVFEMDTAQGVYGGILSFVLVQGSQGNEPSMVTIFGFDQALEAGGCVAELLSSFKLLGAATPTQNT